MSDNRDLGEDGVMNSLVALNVSPVDSRKVYFRIAIKVNAQ